MSSPTKSIDQIPPPTAELSASRFSFRDLLAQAAQAWGLSHPMMLAILLAPFVVAGSGVVAALMGKEAYRWLTEEDQFAETMQVLCYTAACVMCVLVVRYQFKAKQWLIGALYVVLGCGLVFLVGEEMSWGQRVFGWTTPESMVAINKQEETNLHNIHGVGHSFKWIQLLVGAYGTILPLVFLRKDLLARFRKLVDAVVPHWSLVLFFMPMFIWKLFRNLGPPIPERFYYVITNYNEIVELILAMGFCLFLLFQLRKCRREFATESTAR
jgi:hypothetical protein